MYALDLSKEDVERAIAFLPVAREFATGGMLNSDFFASLGDVGFTFLKQFAEANINGTCPKCGEESPLTFSACWNCGQIRESVPAEDEEIETPYLDQVLGSNGGAFGSMKQ